MSALVGLLALIGAIRVVRIFVRTVRACARAIADSYRAIVAHEASKRSAAATQATVDPALVAAIVAAMRAAHATPGGQP